MELQFPAQDYKATGKTEPYFNFCPLPKLYRHVWYRRKKGVESIHPGVYPEEIKQALIDQYDHSEPLGELILAGQAAFDLISHLNIELEVKDAFHQLEKRFLFYRNLLEPQ